MKYKIVCNLCRREHLGPFDTAADAADALHAFNLDALRRDVPPQLLACMQIVPADAIYTEGRWLSPGDTTQPPIPQEP